MNIIFVITNSRGKNLVFVADTLKIYSLKEAIDSARDGSLKNIYPVKSRNGIYLRAKKKISKNNQLDRLSLSSFSLFASKDDIQGALATPSFRAYWHLYQATLYSRSYKKPHGNPEPNDRGIQISHEFYSLAKTWLK